MTAEELKLILSQPLALFAIMLVASLGSAIKQLIVARRERPELSLVQYFTKNLPETIIMLMHNGFAFGTLIMTDSLNWAAALGIGYLANDAADVWTAEGRSTAIGNKQGGFARPLMLAILLAVSVPLLLLSACQTPPHKVIETACTPGTKYSVERCTKGIAETWETYQKRAEIIVADPLTPADVKTSVQQAEAASRPVVVDTLMAGATYAEIKQQVAAGQTEAEKLAIANANLEQWVAKALPLVRNFGRQLDR